MSGISTSFNVGHHKEQISINHQSKLLQPVPASLHICKPHVLCFVVIWYHPMIRRETQLKDWNIFYF